MKKWLTRILSTSEEDAAAAAASPTGGVASAQGARPADLDSEIDAAYYRWLTMSAGYNAPAEIENRILADVEALMSQPEDAAELVPRVPEVIPQILRSLREEDVSAAELARQVVQDVVLMAEVIREANSAYYRPMSPVKTIEAALMMLGQNGLRMLLARIAFRPVIKLQSDGFSRRAAPHVWNQSEKCALAASLMAPGLTAGVFESYLAGLMQNVGLIVAFRLADRVCQEARIPGSGEFGLQLLAHSRRLSAGIAAHWDFPPEVTEAIAHANDPGDAPLASALAQGDRIAKLRLLLDACVLSEDDPLIVDGLNSFQRRCLGKLGTLEG